MAQQKIVAKFLALVTCLLAQGIASAQASTGATSCHVVGRCHSYYTALGLKASIYGIINKRKVRLADCNQEGDFDAQVPLRSTRLILEMDGYKPVNIPIYFAPNLIQDDRFGIWNWGEMVPKDSLPNLPAFSNEKGSLYSIHYHFDDILDIENELMNAANDKVGWSQYLRTKGVRQHDMMALASNEGIYVRRIKTTGGLIISQNQLTIRRGITFESIRIAKPAKEDSVSNSLIDKAIKSTSASIYFDRTSYELRGQARVLLDSIANVLMKQPDLRAKLTGYTDNVGDQKLNMTLSEYRAKVVENYLKGRGVTNNQLTTEWKGSDPKASSDDTETSKVKARRVIIDLSTK